MFFHIGKFKENFPHHYNHNNLTINLDEGWHNGKDCNGNQLFYKGYADNFNLEDILSAIADQEEPLYTGNFCLIKCFDKGITLKTDRYRSFPLWYDKSEGITNLINIGQPIWTDSFAMLTKDYDLIESKFDIIPEFETSCLSFNEVVDRVDQLLREKVLGFVKNNTLPLRSFLTGGIDTGVLYSYLHKLKIANELIKHTHIDFDYFYVKNHVTLMNFWGYNQVHHWKDPCVILSGAPGDEFTVRSPYTVNMMLKYLETSIPKLLEKKEYKNSLHFEYFSKHSYKEIWESQQNLSYNNRKEVITKCLHLILNDYQHWHLGNTITWTPFRDIEFFITIARLPDKELKDHIMNSTVHKALITRNFPELLNCLSTNKNSGNYMENLTYIL